MAIPLTLSPDPAASSSTPPAAAPAAAPADDPAYALAHTCTAHTRAVTALELGAAGLVSAGADGWVHVWDLSGAHVRGWRCHRTGINDISLSPDGLYVATAADDGTALVFALARGLQDAGLLRVFEGHTAPVLSVAFSPTSNRLATGSFDESVIIWDVLGGEALHTIPAHADAVWTVGWDNEGALVITGSADGLIRLWDAHTGQCLRTLDNESNAPVAHAAFTPSSFFLLSSVMASSILVYNLHTSRVLKTLRAPEFVSETFAAPAHVFARPRRRRVPNADAAHGAGQAAEANGDADVDGAASGHDARGEKAMGSQRTAKARASGTLVVAGSENGKIILWDLNERRVVAVLDAHEGPVLAVTVDARSGLLATAGADGKIKVWTP
ncbi:WD domain protein [Cryptotrichosporon argae]